jgi:DNA helicase II / ATP-dependent DNA helicase PcrA
MSAGIRLVRDEQHLRELLGIDFTDEQMAAITAGLDEPIAIIAGAGSGKTTVMAARVVWLVGHEGVAPDRIIGLTFTNKAAAELGQRVRESLARLGDPEHMEWGDPATSTYHAFAGALISEHGLRLGFEPDLRVITDASRFQRFARAVEAFDGEIRHLTTHIPWIVRDCPRLDAELSEHCRSTDELRAFDARLIEVAESGVSAEKIVGTAATTARKRTEITWLVDAYRAAKAADGVMDFSDQMAWGAALAQLPEVRDAVREQFDVVLLDEYQDTSVAQRDLLVGLFRGMPVTAVGDPAQGIYGWRGAATGNLEEFLNDFGDTRDGQRLTLRETRRCAPEIISAANEIVSEFHADSTVQPLTSANPPDGLVEVSLHSTVSDEIAAMVAKISAIRDAGAIPLRSVAILVRVAKENGEIVKALRDAHIPFEIVGLQGLLVQPEVLDVVSLLEVVDDATANPAVLRLATGARWNIGPRDLALLGRRASELAWRPRDDDVELSPLQAALAKSVDGTDPTEIVSLADALADLGDHPYSPEARERFGDLSRVITSVRRHASDPLIDLVRRAVRALDLDIELEAGDVEGGGDNLALFLDAVAAYSETDRYASLSGLLGYLAAEEEFNAGMEVSTPSEAESVKLLTIHRAKGLEWHTVFVPLMSRTVFPSEQGRPNWLTNMLALPTPLRGDRDSLPPMPLDPAQWTDDDGDAHWRRVGDLALMEERRLAYVAYTRAAERLVLSGHWWGRTQQKPLGPSAFLLRTCQWLADNGGEPTVWADPPEDGATNPHLAEVRMAPWPADPPRLDRRHALAEAVRAQLSDPAPVEQAHPELDRIEQDVELLLAEADAAAEQEREVVLPASLSTTSVLTLAGSPAKLARELARPMPRQPSAAARFGTRFHAWVEAHFGQQVLLDPTDLPGRGDVDLASDADLDVVIEQFRNGPYGDRSPVAIEAPFSLVLDGQQVIGRIDAIFRDVDKEGCEHWEVVDWKTNRAATADPLQLAVYRLAWAEMNGLDPADVIGAFYYVRLGEVQRFDDLPGRDELERLLAGESVGS